MVRTAAAVGALAVVLFVVSGPIGLAIPASCGVCHRAVYAGRKASPHAAVACQRCHADRAVLGGVGDSFALASDVYRRLSGDTTAAVSIPDESCLSCHPSAGLMTARVVNGLRISHKGLAEAGYRCVDCHADTAHAVPATRLSRPTMSLCARCHNNVRISGRCTVCHSDTRSADAAQRSDPEWSKTHGPDWRQLHGMGDLSTCSMCHSSQECQQCHKVPLPHDDNFIANHGGLAERQKAACLTCHSQSFCDNCHGLPIPHPAGFLAQHPSVAKSGEDPRCLRCHVQDDCDQCHTAHVHPHGPVVGK